MDLQAEPDFLKAGKDDCQTPRRPLDQAYLQLEPSNQAKGYWKKGIPAKRWEDDLNICLQPDRSNRDNNDLTSDMTWLTTAEDSSKSDAMESDFTNSRLKQPTRPTIPITTTTTTPLPRDDQTTGTTKTHDQNEDDSKDDDEQDDDDDTLLIFSQ